MNILQITHIDKPNRFSMTEAINAFQGPGWGPWTREEAVAWAEIRDNYFVVQSAFSRAEVMVATSINGLKYLRTRADNTLEDNLLYLPPISALAMFALNLRR